VPQLSETAEMKKTVQQRTGVFGAENHAVHNFGIKLKSGNLMLIVRISDAYFTFADFIDQPSAEKSRNISSHSGVDDHC
jgi:hypothetical protein